jgi:hypothetical protein
MANRLAVLSCFVLLAGAFCLAAQESNQNKVDKLFESIGKQRGPIQVRVEASRTSDCPTIAEGSKIHIIWFQHLDRQAAQKAASTGGRSFVAFRNDAVFGDAVRRVFLSLGFSVVDDAADYQLRYDEFELMYVLTNGEAGTPPLIAHKNSQFYLFRGNPSNVSDSTEGLIWKGSASGKLEDYHASPELFLKPVISLMGRDFKDAEVKVNQSTGKWK